jgi:hypothetical protein
MTGPGVAALDRIVRQVERLLADRTLLIEALVDVVAQMRLAELTTEEDRIIWPGLAVAYDDAVAVLDRVLGAGVIGG